VSVLRDRNPLFVTLSDGSIRNGYEVKIINKDHLSHVYRVSIEGLEGARLTGITAGEADATEIAIGPDNLKNAHFFVSLPADRLAALRSGEAKLRFVATSQEGKIAVGNTTFRGPIQ